MGKDYNDALERCKEVFNMNNLAYSPSEIEAKLKYVFPQLETNEDERIKQKIIKLIKKSNEVGGYALHKWEADEMLTWIEKQCQKKIDESKFKVGDWIVYNRNDSSREIMYVYDIRDGRYYFNDNIHFSWSIKECDNKSHLWTIKDAKPGDVLAAHECVVLFKEIVDLNIKCYCTYHYMGFNPSFYVNTLQNKTAFQPATKEQQDLLFSNIKEAGYAFDFEKKELKKIIESNQ